MEKNKTKKINNGTLIFADLQTNGIGTHGRKWYTDEEKNIAFSFYVETNCDIIKLEGITIKIAEIITGLGAITPIGKNVKETWNGIENKKCGIDNISLFDCSNFKTKLDAEVKEYNPLDYFELKQAKRLNRSSQFAIIAAREAVKDSGITRENTDFDRVGVFVGSGIGGLQTIQEQCEVNFEKGNKRVSPMFIPMAICNMSAGNISIELFIIE